MHCLEDSVRAGLQRQMYVLSQFGQPGKALDQIFTKSDWMRRSKSQPFESFNVMHCLQQLNKRALSIDFRELVASIEIHDLPQQRHLFDSAVHQIAHLAHDFTDSSA